MLVRGACPFFVVSHLFTGSKVLPLPHGSWHWRGVWVCTIIALTDSPQIRASFVHQLVELPALSEILEVCTLWSLRLCISQLTLSYTQRSSWFILRTSPASSIHLFHQQVRLQGDMAKPLDKRLNYKHCFDGLFRASLTSQNTPVRCLKMLVDGTRGRRLLAWPRSWSECNSCHLDERQSTSLVRPSPFNPQSPPPPPDSFGRYDFFKRELVKTQYFEDNMACHITASFGAVCDYPQR